MPSATEFAANAAPGIAGGFSKAKLPGCSASTASLPGKYILLYSDGKVKANGYRALDAFWSEGIVSASSSSQSAKAPQTPKQPVYLYSGTYQLKNSKQTGCAYVETTVSGKPFTDSTNNASFAALPNFGTAFNFDGSKGGPLQIGSLKLSATGGNANLTLMLRNHVYDTGTLTLTERIVRNGP